MTTRAVRGKPRVDISRKLAMRMMDRIETKLRAALEPLSLAVSDDSLEHAGHAGAREGGETHFSVDIVAASFAGKNRVARHRMVNEILREEFAAGVHALAVKARAPGEA